MLSNAYFLQNFVLIQPRTSPPKICKILLIFPILLTLTPNLIQQQNTSYVQPRERPGRSSCPGTRRCAGRSPGRPGPRFCRGRLTVGKISAKCCPFSAVSAPIFARKYAFCSIFQNLSDYQAEIFEILHKILQILRHFQKNC